MSWGKGILLVLSYMQEVDQEQGSKHLLLTRMEVNDFLWA